MTNTETFYLIQKLRGFQFKQEELFTFCYMLSNINNFLQGKEEEKDREKKRRKSPWNMPSVQFAIRCMQIVIEIMKMHVELLILEFL